MTKDEALSVHPGIMVRLKHGLKKPALVIETETVTDVPLGTTEVYLTVLISDGVVAKSVHRMWLEQ